MKTYSITCRVCQRDFDIEADFLSLRESDHRGRLIATCNLQSPTHSRDEIRSAYVIGST